MSTARLAQGATDPDARPETGGRLRVVIGGDRGAGKSTLATALMLASGSPRRLAVADPVGEGPCTSSLAAEALTSDCAVIVVDARNGVGREARRQTQVVALLGVRKLVLAINMIDRVSDPHRRFSEIAAGFEAFTAGLGLAQVDCVPISALHGENIVTFGSAASRRQVSGSTLTGSLAAEEIGATADSRPDAEQTPSCSDQLRVTVIWLGEEPMLRGRSYRAQIGTSTVTATVAPIKHRLNPDTHERVAATKLERDEIGDCDLDLSAEVEFASYAADRAAGRLTLIDRITGETVGIGLIQFALRRAQNIRWQALSVDCDDRAALLAQQPTVLWLTGLSGAGKSTLANQLEVGLHLRGCLTYLLDGDNVRHGLNADLGFTDADRAENIRRVAEVAHLMADAGLIVIVSFISPFRAEREMARSMFNDGEFLEVHVDTPLAVAEERDPKGLYRKARRGELSNFTGIDSPYEPPERPEVRIDTTRTAADAAAAAIIELLEARGRLRRHSQD